MLKMAIYVTQNELAKTGLTLADFKVNIYRVKKSNQTTNQVVTDAALQWGVGGFYGYYGSTPDFLTYDYFGTCEYTGAELIDNTFWTFDFDAEVSSRVSQGPGATSWTTPQILDQESGLPIADVACWVTTDAGGLNIIAGTLSTNAQGYATFLLEVGTYYLWKHKNGYNFTNPTQVAVS
ncbi:hypothetical protein ACFLXE_00120 [Chloroflexota bacterium]